MLTSALLIINKSLFHAIYDIPVHVLHEYYTAQKLVQSGRFNFFEWAWAEYESIFSSRTGTCTHTH